MMNELFQCCNNPHCPSHRQARLSQILKKRNENKISSSIDLGNDEKLSSRSIYSKPVAASIVLEKHQNFIDQWTKSMENSTTSTFRNNSLQNSLRHRFVSVFRIDPIDRLKNSQVIRIDQLRIDHLHLNRHFSLRIISKVLWTRYAIHVIVEDETNHCLRLSIYNWSYVFDHRQIFSDRYIEQRLAQLLPIDAKLILFDPWLKICDDGDVSLRCESPNVDLFLPMNFNTNIEDLRRWGNDCYVANDSLGAIQFYTLALEQLNEQTNLTTIELQRHRFRLLSNRAACYIRERHPIYSLEDTKNFAHSFPLEITEKLLHRHFISRLYLDQYDEAKKLLENFLTLDLFCKDFHRLQQKTYDIPKMLQDQSFSSFIDLKHVHRDLCRTDLFEIRSSQNSYGVFALKTLRAGTLLLVESPFVSVEKRNEKDKTKHSINFWHRADSTFDFCSDDVLRLLNEVEKQLLITNGTCTTFNRIQLMQPIRQWISEQTTTSPKVQFTTELQSSKPYAKPVVPPVTSIPWRILFETQQQNPFQSNSTLAWFSIGSMFNHSCLPNCLWYLIDDYLFIYVCASEIHPGEELTISYCPLWISSLRERIERLSRFGISTCQCILCTFDRQSGPQYEQLLLRCHRKKTIGLRNRYDRLDKQYADRPVGFISEFVNVESIEPQPSSLLERFASVCRFDLPSLPHVNHPLFLFGSHLLLLLDQVQLDDNKWQLLFNALFRIFSCHSSSSSSSSTFGAFFRNLIETQTLLSFSPS